jgi:hypothetical protein
VGEDNVAPEAVEVNVVVDGDHLESIDDVAQALADAGLHLHQALKLSGVISGAIEDPELLEALARVDGVASVERGRTFQLPPPDEPTQ